MEDDTVEQVVADLPLHPFSPFAMELPTYVANTIAAPVLVSIFAAGYAVIFLITYGIIQRMRPSMGSGEMAVAMWFALCGCIYLFFDGYFSYNAFDMAGKTDIFGQLWKEYALSDSRYMSQDALLAAATRNVLTVWRSEVQGLQVHVVGSTSFYLYILFLLFDWRNGSNVVHLAIWVLGLIDPKAKNTESLVRNHLVIFLPSGLLTCAGGKWTTYRRMAKDAVEAVKIFNLAPSAVASLVSRC
ncbi:hypothetical protein TrVGV298_002117 [Trichoderma virens]|nr:hypothetical protein TrVGV298_002117 [Trichoderma virens]